MAGTGAGLGHAFYVRAAFVVLVEICNLHLLLFSYSTFSQFAFLSNSIQIVFMIVDI